MARIEAIRSQARLEVLKAEQLGADLHHPAAEAGQ
jgi:hypothetical protein